MKLIEMKTVAAGLLCVAGALGTLTYGCSDEGETSVAKLPDAGAKPVPTPGTPDTGTNDSSASDTGASETGAANAQATATIAATVADGGAAGLATLVETDGEVLLTLVIDGPSGLHGVHVHQNGSCDDAGAAAGGHFNPDPTATHGYPDAAVHHAGDFGNISLDDAGHGTLTLRTQAISLGDGGTSVIGRAVLVHANMDDGTPGTDAGPGNSGARIGCGVIQRTN